MGPLNWDLLKALYLRGDRVSQLNSLHLNLARIQILATGHTDELVALHLIRESQYFIEWIVPTLDLETDEISVATLLVDLQRQLSRWKLDWERIWSNQRARAEVSEQAHQWCERIRLQPSASAELYQQALEIGYP